MNNVGKGELIKSQFVVLVSACLSKISWNRSTYCIIIDILLKDARTDGFVSRKFRRKAWHVSFQNLAKKVQRSPSTCVIGCRNRLCRFYKKSSLTNTYVTRQHRNEVNRSKRLSPFFLLFQIIYSLSLFYFPPSHKSRNFSRNFHTISKKKL